MRPKHGTACQFTVVTCQRGQTVISHRQAQEKTIASSRLKASVVSDKFSLVKNLSKLIYTQISKYFRNF